jgi:hypothetical protein
MRARAIVIAAMAMAMATTTATVTPAAADVPTIPAPELSAIRVLLRSFVPEAVGRHHPGRAWDLATPAMRSTTTRADWRHGSLPVFPYPASATSFGIRPISVSPNDVTFDLMLHPTPGSDVGVEVFTTEVQRIGGRWLVASMAASAQFAGPGGPSTITAEPDFAPSLQGTPQSNNIDQKWVLVPFAVVGLPLIAARLGLILLGRLSRARRPDRETIERSAAPWR